MKWTRYTCDGAKLAWRDGMVWSCSDSEPVFGGHSSEPMFDCPKARYWLGGPKEKAEDVVKEPVHYFIEIDGIKLDCWKVQKALGMQNHHFLASAFAYLWRALKKGNRKQDVEKAIEFLKQELLEPDTKQGA